MYIVGFWNKRNWLTAPLTVDLSLYVSSFLSWYFHIWHNLMSSTCYIFSPIYFFHWFSQVVTNFTFTSGTYVILLLLKGAPVKRNEKIIRENCGTQTRRSNFWRYMRCSFGTLHFTQCPTFSTTSKTYLAWLL